MKKQLYILSLALATASVSAQTVKRADRLFNAKAYADAITNYTQLDKTQSSLENLADSYYYTLDLENAKKTYDELINTYGEITDTNRLFRYAQALKSSETSEKADELLAEITGINYAPTSEFKDENDKTTPHIFSSSILKNTDAKSDFGMTFIDDKTVAFASARTSSNPTYKWNNTAYLDLYTAKYNNGELTDVTALPNVNTTSHESNATFSKDGKIMFFNRTNKERKDIDGEKVANIKLYRAELVDGKWTNETVLPFSSDDYNTEHPALSKDGKTLYFASDMIGGYGSFDIYKVAVHSDGTYGNPKNLGDKVNTNQREQFPFISDINTLYFASNGHQGYGNLDLFRSEEINGNFTKPTNLGKSVNSKLDDFSFTISEKTNRGFFSSNRSQEDALYSFTREENILTKYAVEGIVQDLHSKEILAGSLVTLMDETGVVIQDTIVGKDAQYLFKIEPNKKYTVRGTRKLYIPVDVEFSTDAKGKVSHNILLTLESYADAEERIRENERGIVQVQLERIYFDFNKSVIRPDAANTLNTLVNLLKKYPYMEIEIASHTDARGGSQYNLDLSKDRAASTLEYIVSQGIERNRLRSIGYGEMQPLNKCVREGMCTDKQYDVNRRSEFTLLK